MGPVKGENGPSSPPPRPQPSPSHPALPPPGAVTRWRKIILEIYFHFSRAPPGTRSIDRGPGAWRDRGAGGKWYFEGKLAPPATTTPSHNCSGPPARKKMEEVDHERQRLALTPVPSAPARRRSFPRAKLCSLIHHALFPAPSPPSPRQGLPPRWRYKY
jgi:hypothetical protein